MSLPDLSKFKALYLEDEVLIAMDGEGILKSIGIRDIHVAYSIDDAVKEMENTDFDLALLDVNLKDGMSSVELAEKLIERGTIVVFASGYNPSEKIVGDLNAPLVAKPFDERTIRAAFAEAFARRGRP